MRSVSYFKYRDAKLFLSKLGSELKNLVKKFQSPMKIQKKCWLNFHEVENFYHVQCTEGVSARRDVT